MSEEENDAIRNGFIRQRRNLIVISLVLLFAETSELEISKLNVFGNELVIHQPITVTIALVVAYLYWLYRYYVYFNDVADKGFHNKYKDRKSLIVKRWCEMRFNVDSAWRQGLIQKVRDMLVNAQAGDHDLRSTLDTSTDWVLIDAWTIDKQKYREFSVQLSLRLYVTKDGIRTNYRDGQTQIILSGRKAIFFSTKATLYVLVHTRVLSEYYLPYLIAAAPALFSIYRLLWDVKGNGII